MKYHELRQSFKDWLPGSDVLGVVGKAVKFATGAGTFLGTMLATRPNYRGAFDGYFDKVEKGQIFWRSPPLGKGVRGVFLEPESAQPHFDYENTFLYKILP